MSDTINTVLLAQVREKLGYTPKCWAVVSQASAAWHRAYQQASDADVPFGKRGELAYDAEAKVLREALESAP